MNVAENERCFCSQWSYTFYPIYLISIVSALAVIAGRGHDAQYLDNSSLNLSQMFVFLVCKHLNAFYILNTFIIILTWFNFISRTFVIVCTIFCIFLYSLRECCPLYDLMLSKFKVETKAHFWHARCAFYKRDFLSHSILNQK